MTLEADAVNEVLFRLVKRGCSPAEALDYYFVEIGPYNQTEWAEVRDITQSSVAENIAKARQKMV